LKTLISYHITVWCHDLEDTDMNTNRNVSPGRAQTKL